MDERINKIKEMLIAGLPEFAINEVEKEATKEEIEKAKLIIKGDFKYYEDALRYNRLQMLYKKNYSVGDFRECRAILNEINEISKRKKY